MYTYFSSSVRRPQNTDYQTDSTPLLTPDNGPQKIGNSGDVRLDIDSLSALSFSEEPLSEQRNLKDIIFLADTGMQILSYLSARDILKISILNKEYRQNFLIFSQPQKKITNNLETNENIKKNEELYFPLFLENFLASPELDKRKLGLSYINDHFENLLYTSRYLLNQTIKQTQEDFNIVFFAKLSFADFGKKYSNILHKIFNFHAYPSRLEDSIFTQTNSRSHYVETIIEIKDLLSNTNNIQNIFSPRKFFDKKFPLNFLSMLIIYNLLKFIENKQGEKIITPVVAILISAPLAICNLINSFGLSYSLPQALDKLETRLNFLKRLVSTQRIFSKLERRLLNIPESKKNISKINQSQMRLHIINLLFEQLAFINFFLELEIFESEDNQFEMELLLDNTINARQTISYFVNNTQEILLAEEDVITIISLANNLLNAQQTLIELGRNLLALIVIEQNTLDASPLMDKLTTAQQALIMLTHNVLEMPAAEEHELEVTLLINNLENKQQEFIKFLNELTEATNTEKDIFKISLLTINFKNTLQAFKEFLCELSLASEVNQEELNISIKNKSNREKLRIIRDRLRVALQEGLALQNSIRDSVS